MWSSEEKLSAYFRFVLAGRILARARESRQPPRASTAHERRRVRKFGGSDVGPAVAPDGECFLAKICLVDDFGNGHWTRRLTYVSSAALAISGIGAGSGAR